MKYSLLVLAVCLVASATTNAQEQSAKTVRSANLHELPKSTSPIKSSLPAQSNINISDRHRAWYHVKSSQSIDGWVKMLNVRFTDGVKREGQIGVEGVFENMVTRQLLPTASTGVRGFDEEALKKAKANKEQVKKLHTFKVNQSDVVLFAANGKLVTNTEVKITQSKE